MNEIDLTMFPGWAQPIVALAMLAAATAGIWYRTRGESSPSKALPSQHEELTQIIVDGVQQQLDRLTRELDQARAQVQEQDSQLEAQESALRSLRDTLGAVRTSMAWVDQQLARLEREVATLVTELGDDERYQDRAAALERSISDVYDAVKRALHGLRGGQDG